MKALAAAATFGLSVVAAWPAGGAEPEDLGAILEPVRERFHVPALAGALLRGDQIVAIGAVGVRKQGSPERVTPADSWQLGSCTKAMTATLAARLVEAGKLSWDTRVAEALPGLEIHAGYRDVTLAELLAHRGGAPGDEILKLPVWSWLFQSRAPVGEARSRLVKDVLERRPEKERGTYYYSNAGYVIASAMLEARTGEPWEALMQRELFTPLGMKAGFGVPGSPGRVLKPWGHAIEGRGVRAIEPGPGADNPPATGPAGGVHVTLADWARFVALHLAGARGEQTLLSAAAMNKLHTPPAGDYALGWVVTHRAWSGGTVLMHRGTNTRFIAEVWIFPSLDSAVLIVTNQGGDRAGKAIAEAGNRIVRQGFPERFD